MSTDIVVAPSLLAADPMHFAEELEDIRKAGTECLHVDVMDGSFVPPITFGTNIVAELRKTTKFYLDTHLMIRHPEHHLEAFCKAGSHRITIHQEATPHAHRVLGEIRRLGMHAGIAINPGTPVEHVFDVLEVCDLVLIMTVNPGWGGQKFITSCLKKVEKTYEFILKSSLSTIIQVDGGINEQTAKECVNAGARVLVAGSSVFGETDRAQAIRKLQI